MEALRKKKIQQLWSTFVFVLFLVCQVLVCLEQTLSSTQTSQWTRERERQAKPDSFEPCRELTRRKEE